MRKKVLVMILSATFCLTGTSVMAEEKASSSVPAAAEEKEEKKGCGSAINSTYAVLALVGVLGFAFVAKKKD